MLPLLVGSYEICIKKKLCWRKKMYNLPQTIVLLLMLYHTKVYANAFKQPRLSRRRSAISLRRHSVRF